MILVIPGQISIGGRSSQIVPDEPGQLANRAMLERLDRTVVLAHGRGRLAHREALDEPAASRIRAHRAA